MDPSTVMPRPKIKPVRVIRFNEYPMKNITSTVSNIDIGIEIPMMKVDLTLLRKMKSTTMTRTMP